MARGAAKGLGLPAGAEQDAHPGNGAADGPGDGAARAERHRRPPRPAGPASGAPEATATVAVLAWVLGALGPLVRLSSHGVHGLTAAIVLGTLTAALATLLASAPLRAAWVAGSAAALAILAELLTVELVGRAPAPVTVAGVVVASVALGSVRLGPARGYSPTALLLVPVGSLGWAATGSPLWLAAWAASLAVAWRTAQLGRPRPVDELRPTAVWRRLAADRGAALAGLVAAGLAVPLFHRLASDAAVVVRGVNDFDDHYERVVPLAWSPFKLTAPHPLFHVLTKWLEIVVGSAAAMTLIMVGALAAMAVTLVRVARSTDFGWRPLGGGWEYALPAVYLLGASPAVLLETGDAWWNRNEGFEVAGRGAGYFPLHVWGSPTLTLAMAMYLALVPLALRLVADPTDRRRGVQVMALTVAVALTSPSGILGLAPGLALLLVARARATERGRWWQQVRASLWLIGPAAVVVAWQMWFLATSQSPLEETTWRFNPFWMVEHFEMDRPSFWALLLVPLAGVLVAGRRYFTDPTIAWCGFGFVVSLFPTFLLQETGWKSTHGGLAMTTFVCASLISAWTIRLLLVEVREAWSRRDERPPGASRCVAALVLLLVAAAGVLDYLTSVGLLDRA